MSGQMLQLTDDVAELVQRLNEVRDMALVDSVLGQSGFINWTIDDAIILIKEWQMNRTDKANGCS